MGLVSYPLEGQIDGVELTYLAMLESARSVADEFS